MYASQELMKSKFIFALHLLLCEVFISLEHLLGNGQKLLLCNRHKLLLWKQLYFGLVELLWEVKKKSSTHPYRPLFLPKLHHYPSVSQINVHLQVIKLNEFNVVFCLLIIDEKSTLYNVDLYNSIDYVLTFLIISRLKTGREVCVILLG